MPWQMPETFTVQSAEDPIFQLQYVFFCRETWDLRFFSGVLN
jgi:hypothetical protein